MRAQTGARLHKDYLREGNPAGERIYSYQAEGEEGGAGCGLPSSVPPSRGYREAAPAVNSSTPLFDPKLSSLDTLVLPHDPSGVFYPLEKALRLYSSAPSWLQAEKKAVGHRGNKAAYVCAFLLDSWRLDLTPQALPKRQLSSPSSSPVFRQAGNPTPAAGDCAFKLLLSEGASRGMWEGGKHRSNRLLPPSPPRLSRVCRVIATHRESFLAP